MISTKFNRNGKEYGLLEKELKAFIPGISIELYNAIQQGEKEEFKRHFSLISDIIKNNQPEITKVIVKHDQDNKGRHSIIFTDQNGCKYLTIEVVDDEDFELYS